MADQHLAQTAKQSDDTARIRREETLPEQEEEVVQSTVQRAAQVIASPADAEPDDVTALQQVAGNRAVSQLIAPQAGEDDAVVQAKLMVGAPGDKYEREADQVAAKVMNAEVTAAVSQPAAEGAVQRFQTLEQIDEAIKKRKERDKKQAQQKKTGSGQTTAKTNGMGGVKPKVQTGGTPEKFQKTLDYWEKLEQKNTVKTTSSFTKKNVNAIKQGSETEQKRNLKQQVRNDAGNEFSHRNLKQTKKQPQKNDDAQSHIQPSQPTINGSDDANLTAKNTVKKPQKQQVNSQHSSPDENLKQLRLRQKKVAIALTGSNVTQDMISEATDLIRQGPKTEEKRLLKQNLRNAYSKVISHKEPEKEPVEEHNEEPKQKLQDDTEEIAMMWVAVQESEAAAAAAAAEEEYESEEEAVEEERQEEEETEAVEETDEEETKEDEVAAEQTEEEEDENWVFSNLLQEPDDSDQKLKIRRKESESEERLSFANSPGVEKRTASTRVAREEPGIPGLKGVSEEIWLKPLDDLISTQPQTKEAGQAQMELAIQRQPATDGSFEVEDDVEQRLTQEKGKGRSLPDDVRTDMEARFGADFSNVRIHTGSEATQLSENLNAQAFTYGNNIFFNSGKGNFDTTDNKRLLAHELTHVVQQMGYGNKDDSSNG